MGSLEYFFDKFKKIKELKKYILNNVLLYCLNKNLIFLIKHKYVLNEIEKHCVGYKKNQ